MTIGRGLGHERREEALSREIRDWASRQAVVVDGLNQPTSLELIGNTAFERPAFDSVKAHRTEP